MKFTSLILLILFSLKIFDKVIVESPIKFKLISYFCFFLISVCFMSEEKNFNFIPIF